MADRPLECSHCKKPIEVCYKEIVGESIICSEMCADCPILQERLHGEPETLPNRAGSLTGLCCDKCRTTLSAVKMSNPLGCPECYEVFADVLLTELSAADKIPPRLKKGLALKKILTPHVGKSPHTETILPPSIRLTALNEALNEAVKRENYEQAAWLRDQIKTLMEKTHGN